MKRATEVDRKVTYVMVNRPPGAQGHLETVEVTVRGRLAQPDIWIRDALRLPHLQRDGGQIYAWPPPAPNLAVEMASMPVPGHPGADWHKAIDERDRQRHEESERLSAFYEAREREAERRREAEVREAREAHRRQHGG
jgi:hypothetical protein